MLLHTFPSCFSAVKSLVKKEPDRTKRNLKMKKPNRKVKSRPDPFTPLNPKLVTIAENKNSQWTAIAASETIVRFNDNTVFLTKLTCMLTIKNERNSIV